VNFIVKLFAALKDKAQAGQLALELKHD